MRGSGEHKARLELELRVVAPARAERAPVTCGIPWPRGTLADPSALRLLDEQGRAVPLQARALDRWADGSVRWTLLDWQASGGQGIYRVGSAEAEAVTAGPRIALSQAGQSTTVQTGAASFILGPGSAFPFQSALVGEKQAIDLSRTEFVAEDAAGRVYRPRMDTLRVEEAGPLRTLLRLEGVLDSSGVKPLADLLVRMSFYAGLPVVRFDLTLRNPRKAEHPGGLWDLGNGGSIYLRDAALTVALPAGAGPAQVSFSPEAGAPFAAAETPVELYQDSSGGENWRSSNHINRQRVVPNRFQGYRLRAGDAERSGLRATPALALNRGERTLGVAMPWFWQNFPKAAEATDESVTLRLFPRQSADVHELQGGEQKTHTFYLLFAGPAESALAWCRDPARASASPAWYCSAGAVPYLTPRDEDPNTGYLALVDAALEGPDTFEHKREVIDEFGWRHFGEVYGDHEAVFHKGPTPLVSHYNNQYDTIAGFAYQFCRGGDWRWFQLMDQLAWHVQDIDIYHTDRDKAAYNHGLFWHTFHYVDVDTGTHRSYPRAAGVCGGGPGNEQNYTTGLMLHYFLTGSPSSREAALGLARWVIDMDDGHKTVFGWLAGGATGLASSSRTPSYHGPGRGSANSVAALLDGHRLTGDPAFLTKAEELIRRVIHPADDVPARNLLDAENRWFYTMFLQSLGRYLAGKAERGELDRMYAYARSSLLHYARWMAEHEYPYLDKPEILEYPTETWAAQDMRKSEVFYHAALHAVGAERARFLERAEFFFRSSTQTLGTLPTRTLARPVILLLSNGLMHSWFVRHPDASLPPPAEPGADFGQPEVFIPQKVRALRRAKALAAAALVVGAAAAVGLLLRLLS
jgi:hypothetical protein